jgi:hypothetical protein
MYLRWLEYLNENKIPEMDLADHLKRQKTGAGSSLFAPEVTQPSYEDALRSQECIGLYL